MNDITKQVQEIRKVMREKPEAEMQTFRADRMAKIKELGFNEGRLALIEQYKHVLPVEPTA